LFEPLDTWGGRLHWDFWSGPRSFLTRVFPPGLRPGLVYLPRSILPPLFFESPPPLRSALSWSSPPPRFTTFGGTLPAGPPPFGGPPLRPLATTLPRNPRRPGPLFPFHSRAVDTPPNWSPLTPFFRTVCRSQEHGPCAGNLGVLPPAAPLGLGGVLLQTRWR